MIPVQSGSRKKQKHTLKQIGGLNWKWIVIWFIMTDHRKYNSNIKKVKGAEFRKIKQEQIFTIN
jgi:transposase